MEPVSEECVPPRLCKISVEDKQRVKVWLDMQRVVRARPKESTKTTCGPLPSFEFAADELSEVDTTLPQKWI